MAEEEQPGSELGAVLSVFALCVASQLLLLCLLVLLKQAFGGVESARPPRRRFGTALVGHTQEWLGGLLTSPEAIVEQRFVLFEWIVLATGRHARTAMTKTRRAWPWTSAGKRLLPDSLSPTTRKLSAAHESLARKLVVCEGDVDVWAMAKQYAFEMLFAVFSRDKPERRTFEAFVDGLDALVPWPNARRAKAKLASFGDQLLFDIASRYGPLSSAVAVCAHRAMTQPARWRADHKALCDEAMRLRPPVLGVLRRATDPFDLAASKIDAGTTVFCDLRDADKPLLDDLSLALLRLFVRLLQQHLRSRQAVLELRTPDVGWVHYPTTYPLALLAAVVPSPSPS